MNIENIDRDKDLELLRKYAKVKLNAEVNQLGQDSLVVRPTGDSRQSATVFLSYASMRALINQQATRRHA